MDEAAIDKTTEEHKLNAEQTNAENSDQTPAAGVDTTQKSGETSSKIDAGLSENNNDNNKDDDAEKIGEIPTSSDRHQLLLHHCDFLLNSATYEPDGPQGDIWKVS